MDEGSVSPMHSRDCGASIRPARLTLPLDASLLPAPLTMHMTLSPGALARYASTQMNRFFPDGNDVAEQCVLDLLEPVLLRLQQSFEGLLNPYFHKDGRPFFNHLHSEQYAAFLYCLGNESARAGDAGADLAAKSYLLNKALHGLDLYYRVELPSVFWLAHPTGTVIGKAEFSGRLAVMQGVTIGNSKSKYPVFGDGVILCSQSSVIGDCHIGNEVCIGAGALVVDRDIPDGSTVVGCGKDLRILPRPAPILKTIFKH